MEIKILGYADDLVMITDSRIKLQRMIGLLENFLDNARLLLNLLKSKILVFRNGSVLSKYDKWFL